MSLTSDDDCGMTIDITYFKICDIYGHNVQFSSTDGISKVFPSVFHYVGKWGRTMGGTQDDLVK